ncbi:hypothetical protein JCM3765_006173 [Sporobolomyces pararoseus]
MKFFSIIFTGGIALAGFVKGQKAGTFEIVGLSGVSAQQLFQHKNKVYIIDKTENNTAQVNGHPAWAVSYDLETNTFRPQDIVSNSFCAGGIALGNGSYLNVGGNAAVTALGVGVGPDSPNPYGNIDGGKAIRMITPCDDDSCEWTDDVNAMPLSRWYPTVETLPDGTAIIIGGELYGSFVNTPQGGQNVPSIEFWPRRSPDDLPVNVTFLEDTMPINLYPLTWLLSNGLLFMQAGWTSTLYDYNQNLETRLPNITHAQRPYPAGAGSLMLPMLPPDYSQTIIFAGGVNPEREDWNQNEWDIIDTPASSSVVGISPLEDSPTWQDYDDLPEGRTMGNLIQLPDQRVLLLNGAAQGSEGYGWDDFALNQSYAQGPRLSCRYFDARAPIGSQWDLDCGTSTIPRMYHSTATLLFDGSVFVAGSNPNVDVINDQNNASYVFHTEYRVERFYPSYYDAPRPQPTGLPSSISYGGSYFDLYLEADNLVDVADFANDISIVLIRTGFSTHVMNMGARMLVLAHSFTSSSNGTILHCSQLPANPSLFAPGPALLFVVVKGIPSFGQEVMVGTGQLGEQPTLPASVLPESSTKESGGPVVQGGKKQQTSSASKLGVQINDKLAKELGLDVEEEAISREEEELEDFLDSLNQIRSHLDKLGSGVTHEKLLHLASGVVKAWNKHREKDLGKALVVGNFARLDKEAKGMDISLAADRMNEEHTQANQAFEAVCKDMVETLALDEQGSEEILAHHQDVLKFEALVLPSKTVEIRALLLAATPQGMLLADNFRLIKIYSEKMMSNIRGHFRTNANFLARFDNKHPESIKVATNWSYLLAKGLQRRETQVTILSENDPFESQLRRAYTNEDKETIKEQIGRSRTNSLSSRRNVHHAFIPLSRSSIL